MEKVLRWMAEHGAQLTIAPEGVIDVKFSLDIFKDGRTHRVQRVVDKLDLADESNTKLVAADIVEQMVEELVETYNAENT